MEKDKQQGSPGITQTLVLEFDVCPIADSTVNATSGRPHQTQRCSGRCCRPIRRVDTAKQGTCASAARKDLAVAYQTKKKEEKKKVLPADYG